MYRLATSALFMSCLATAVPAADLLTLDDGRTLEGEYIGGGRASISFVVDTRVERFALAKVRNLRFDAARQPLAEAPAEPLTDARIVTTGGGLQALQIQPLQGSSGTAN